MSHLEVRPEGACRQLLVLEMWPTSLLDLNPLDFSIWVYIQLKACSCQHPNLESLKVAVEEHLNNMSEDNIMKVFSKFRPRIEAVIKA